MYPFSYLKISACLLMAVFSSGCIVYEKYGYGKAAGSKLPAEDVVAVEIPANAPSISQRFMPLWGPSEGRGVGSRVRGEHRGFDILVATGTAVIAPAPGVVVAHEKSLMFGRQLMLNHAETAAGFQIQTRYFHLDEILVEVGESVTRGQLLAYSGNSGLASGGLPHLHFEVHRILDRVGSNPFKVVDPQLFWVAGAGRISCYEKNLEYSPWPISLTYPVPCKDTVWQ